MADTSGSVRIELPEHDRPPRPGETDLERTDPDLELTATLVLRRPTAEGDQAAAAQEADLFAVLNFARLNGLRVTESEPNTRSVTLAGRASDFERILHVELIDVELNGKRYRRYDGAPSLPAGLGEIVTGVFGLRARPTRPRPRVHHAGSTEPFWTTVDLARAYDFPEGTDGTGQVIGLIELGGGYDEQDLRAFFSEHGLPVPSITFKSIDGATNQPASPEAIQQWLDVVEGRREESDCDATLIEAAQMTVEVTMDIELAGALAPGAQLVVYMAPATEEGIYKALSLAIHDEQPRVDVISMSWGEPESFVSDAHVSAITQVLEDAAQRGITVCASSGDFGAYDDPQNKTLCVNFPASSPLVLACGGSTVVRCESKIDNEIAWNCGLHGIPASTGGGVSELFGLPPWQSAEHVPLSPKGQPGRGVPDVAASADPHNGCAIIVGGQPCSSFGTSAVAPLWAALIARCNQALGSRAGHLNPVLYELARSERSPFRTIVEGDNGFYRAGAGWNACTGLGTPKGRHLLDVLRARTSNSR
jgi:kumamolisin